MFQSDRGDQMETGQRSKSLRSLSTFFSDHMETRLNERRNILQKANYYFPILRSTSNFYGFAKDANREVASCKLHVRSPPTTLRKKLLSASGWNVNAINMKSTALTRGFFVFEILVIWVV